MTFSEIIVVFALFTGALWFNACAVHAKSEESIKDISEAAPDFSLVDQTGNTVTLDGLTATGPTVLVFYRGQW